MAMEEAAFSASSGDPSQVHKKKRIEVDSHLRVKDTPAGEIYAIGDCATVRFNGRWRLSVYLFTDKDFAFIDLVIESDKDKNGKFDFGEWEHMG